MVLYSEKEREKISNVSYHCVAEFLSSTKEYLDFNTLSGVASFSKYLLLNLNYLLQWHETFKCTALCGKGIYFNPSHREKKMFDVGVVSIQSSLGHWNHICKSCLMNNVYVNSVCRAENCLV